MIITIILSFISLIALVVIHEYGHFVLAKKFGVKVEEFGIGYPPRIWGKKFGETIYSINLLPFGAFVRIPGEIERLEDSRSFSRKPIWQRALIVFGGALSFWIVAAILLSVVMGLGASVAISDDMQEGIINPKVQIGAVAPGSPAEKAGIKAGDAIKEISFEGQKIIIGKTKEVQDFTNSRLGQELIFTIERGKQVFEARVVPRTVPPAGEGPMGVVLVRTASKSYPWYQAPFQGIFATYNLTIAVVQGWWQALVNVFKGAPTGVQLMGPVGIMGLFVQVSQLGIIYYLQFIAMISVYVALFNMLPIPAVDGGKLMFLAIEAIGRKPVPAKIEGKITVAFFVLLLILMVWVTINDIIRLF